MLINDAVSITSAFLIGLLSGVHCIGMCGGIVSALSFAVSDKPQLSVRLTTILSLYNLGRILSYCLAGVVVGALGGLVQGTHSMIVPGLRIFAGLMLVSMGLYLAGWWRGLTYFERLGGYAWRYIQPIANRMIPVQNGKQALVLGLLWGWLPCGLVYSMLTYAAVTANWQQSALIMLSFGLGTLPVMLVSGIMARQLKVIIQQRLVRNVSAILIIGFGIWTLTTPILHLNHNHPATENQHREHHH